MKGKKCGIIETERGNERNTKRKRRRGVERKGI